jgi:hypothetical protein
MLLRYRTSIRLVYFKRTVGFKSRSNDMATGRESLVNRYWTEITFNDHVLTW